MPTTEETTTEATEAPETPSNQPEEAEGTPEPDSPAEGHTEAPEGTPEGAENDTFPRSYVEELRRESAGYRTKAAQAEALADALWTARVAASGALADPTDLPRPEDADALDPEAVTSAVSELLERKPHLAARVPRGNVGQGFSKAAEPVSLLGMLRNNAG